MKKEILVLLYDLSSPFDTVCHKILLEKLKIYGFCESSMKWMKSYLQSRKQVLACQLTGQLILKPRHWGNAQTKGMWDFVREILEVC